MSLPLLLACAAPVWWLTFHIVGGIKLRGPWDGKFLDLVGWFGGAGLMGASAACVWVSLAQARWAAGGSVPVAVHAVGAVGVLMLGAALFAAVVAALFLVSELSNRSRDRHLARFASELAAAVASDPAVLRVWVVHPFVIRSNPPMRPLLAVATRGEPVTDFESFRERARHAAGLPQLPDLVIGPEDPLSGPWQIARRYGRCLYDRDASPMVPAVIHART